MDDIELDCFSDSELDLNRDVFSDKPVRIPRRRHILLRRSSINVLSRASDSANENRSYIAVQRIIDLLRSPTYQTFTNLKKTLDKFKLQPEWISEFLHQDGLELLFESLEQLCRSKADNFLDVILQVSCVECVRTVMDSPLSLDYIIENKEFIRKLASGKLLLFCYRFIIIIMELYMLLPRCGIRYSPYFD